LLRQASYNLYHAPAWLAVDAPFVRVQPEADGATWQLRRDHDLAGRVTMSAYLTRGRGMLALPNGAARLDELMVVGLSQNRLRAGALRRRLRRPRVEHDGAPLGGARARRPRVGDGLGGRQMDRRRHDAAGVGDRGGGAGLGVAAAGRPLGVGHVPLLALALE